MAMTFTVVDGVTAVIALFALCLSLFQYRFSRSTTDRPVLVFALASSACWRVANVGSGPAVNLKMADRGRAGESQKVVNCAPLAVGGHIDVPWLDAGHELVAIYTDVHGREYTTTCQGNVNRIVRKNAIPQLRADREQYVEEAIHRGRRDARISDSHLRDLSAVELDILRNAIYARHGYVFNRKGLDAYFRRQPWYRPQTAGVDKGIVKLTPGEAADVYRVLSFQNRRGLRTSPPVPQLFDDSFRPVMPLPYLEPSFEASETDDHSGSV